MKKNLILFGIFFFISSCGSDPKQELSSFQFLLGDWERINNQEGFKTYESWKMDINDNYEGFGYTLQGEDTVFKEYMQLMWIDSALFLAIEGVNEQATLFYVDERSSTAFTCVNDSNEFPKKIAYSYYNEELKAIISDDSNEVKFTFRRQ